MKILRWVKIVEPPPINYKKPMSGNKFKYVFGLTSIRAIVLLDPNF